MLEDVIGVMTGAGFAIRCGFVETRVATTNGGKFWSILGKLAAAKQAPRFPSAAITVLEGCYWGWLKLVVISCLSLFKRLVSLPEPAHLEEMTRRRSDVIGREILDQVHPRLTVR